MSASTNSIYEFFLIAPFECYDTSESFLIGTGVGFEMPFGFLFFVI
jgi:hypothetical protein